MCPFIRICCNIHVGLLEKLDVAMTLVKKKKKVWHRHFCPLVSDDITLSFFSVRLFLLVVQVEVQHQQFGFLRPVPAAGGAHQPSVGRSDSPHNST